MKAKQKTKKKNKTAQNKSLLKLSTSEANEEENKKYYTHTNN